MNRTSSQAILTVREGVYYILLIMKYFLLSLLALTLSVSLNGQNIPYMSEDGQLIVDGKPFLMYAGELHNSTTGSAHKMAPVWQQMADININSVFAAVSWELVEPEEGKFDFTLVDEMIEGCREADLKLVILWFGSWKNGRSTYAPAWVKTDQKRFPLVWNKDGSVSNTLSTLGKETMKADANAFARLMKHIKEVDGDENTVIMVQVQNEIGTLGPERDYSPIADKAFKSQVPSELTSWLKKNEKKLQPSLRDVWVKNGRKTAGTWEEVFGQGAPDDSEDWQNAFPYYTEEIFNAWNYATYVGHIAEAGKAEYPLPLYVNAWLKQPGGRAPGRYPSGAALPHVFDIWRAAAPAIDFYAPDIYAVDVFDWVMESFGTQNNPIFIPEIESSASSAARAFYAFGKYDIRCYSPFGIDGGGSMLSASHDAQQMFKKAYGCLKNLEPYILKYQGTDEMTGLYTTGDKKTDSVDMGTYTVSIREFSTRRAASIVGAEVGEQAQGRASAMGVLVIKLAENDFLVAGGVGEGVINISKTDTSDGSRSGLLSVDEITFDENGNMLTHRLNGDETGFGGARIANGDIKTFRIKMYNY